MNSECCPPRRSPLGVIELDFPSNNLNTAASRPMSFLSLTSFLCKIKQTVEMWSGRFLSLKESVSSSSDVTDTRPQKDSSSHLTRQEVRTQPQEVRLLWGIGGERWCKVPRCNTNLKVGDGFEILGKERADRWDWGLMSQRPFYCVLWDICKT